MPGPGTEETPSGDPTKDTEDKEKPKAVDSSERTPARRLSELSLVVSANLNAAYRKNLDGSDGKEKDSETPQEKALRAYHHLKSGENVSGPVKAENPILMPELPNVKDTHGVGFTFGAGELRLSGIVDTTEDGKLVCVFENTVTNERVVDSAGNPLQIPVTRDAIANAQLIAEREVYEGIFEGEQKTVMSAHIDGLLGISPGAEVDAAIEAAAKTNKQLTASSVKESTDYKALPEDERAKLDTVLNGVGVLTLPEWQAVAPMLGLDRAIIAKKADELSAAIIHEKEKLKANSEDKFAQARIEELQTELNMVAQMDEALKTGEDGKSPMDAVFEQLQNGELSPEVAEAVRNGLTSGDTQAIVDGIEKTQDVTETQKAWLREHGGKIGKGVLWAILLGVIAIPVTAAVAGGAAALGVVKAGGGSR